MNLVRGEEYKVNFFGKVKDSFYYGCNEDGIHCFVLKRKSKKPNGQSTKYLFSKDLKSTVVS